MVLHLAEAWGNLTCDQAFFLRARETYKKIIERGHDLRLRETRKWPQKCKKQNRKKQQTSKELNDASLSLFICC